MRLLSTEPLMALLVLLTALETHGHGRLREPPSRSSMWRDGFDNIPNYTDNQLSCGGTSIQNVNNGGKCGICGDPWQKKIRDNEAGGKYANGIITRTYMEGQVIGVAIEITAQHGGWYEFRICPNNDIHKPATHECLNQHVLPLADGSGNRVYMKTGTTGGRNGFHNTTLSLPSGLTCTQCVLQWKWHTGNSWGTNPDGQSCVGCGPQEEFYGCSDVAIKRSSQHPQADSPDTPMAEPSPPYNPQGASAPYNPQAAASPTMPQEETNPSKVDVASGCALPRNPVTNNCVGAPGFEGNRHMESWCRLNCPLGNCPLFLCRCGPLNGLRKICKATNIGLDAKLDTWCASNCAAGFCPPSLCKCETITA